MNIKMATNSQLSTTESKKETKQTIRTGTESQTSHGGYHMEVYQWGRGGGNEGKGTGNKKHKW